MTKLNIEINKVIQQHKDGKLTHDAAISRVRLLTEKYTEFKK